jgi:HrpA-like RNA helicase
LLIAVQIINFPFPTAPPAAALQRAEQALVHIAALQPCSATSAKAATGSALKLTTIGKAMAGLPLPPRHSRIILEAASLVAKARNPDRKVVLLAVALAAVLSTESPFLHSDSVAASGTSNRPLEQVWCCL